MSSWDDVETDFGGDETGNFGPRLESGSALYQIETAATISPRGVVTEVPYVCASAVEKEVCLVAGSHVSVFTHSGHTFVATITFDCTVDGVAWSEDGSFLAVGDRKGEFHLYDAQSQNSLFSKVLVSEDETDDGPTFQQIFFTPLSDEGVCSLVMVTTGGQLFLFSNIHISDLQEALRDGNLRLAKDLQSLIKMDVIATSEVHTDCTLSASLTNIGVGRDLIITVGQGEVALCVWENADDGYCPVRVVSSASLRGSAILKMRSTPCGRYLIVLNDQRQLSLWSVHTMTQVKRWSRYFVKDFFLLDSEDRKNSLHNVKVVMLSDCGVDKSELHICTLPHLESIYQVQLSAHTTLATCTPFQEALFLIEGVANDTNDHGYGMVSTLRLRCLSEAQPETRFYRILHKKHFDEAEAFAIQFNLDVELVYKVKVNWILDCLAPWKTHKLQPEEIDTYLEQLQTCLIRIKDDASVVETCVKATPPSFEATVQLLNYARDRIKKSVVVENGHDDESISRAALMTRVQETLHRLATYHTAFGIQNFRANDWCQFQSANIFHEFLRYLGQRKTSIAFTIWRRHQSEFDDLFSCDVVEDILCSVPEQMTSDALRPWLAEDFIPYIIKTLPKALGLVAVWLQQRARNMEILEKGKWPAVAIEICELLQSTCMSMSQSVSRRGLATPHHFITYICNLSVGYSQIQNTKDGQDSNDPFVQLHKLINQLQDLHSLHTVYNCKLTLAEYIQETTESLTYRMLDRVVAVELIPDTLAKIVRPYMKQHGLNQDRILFQYIADLAERSGKISSCLGEAPWEAKAIAVIGCIHDPEYKCRAILDAMVRAYIPWSADMENLVQQGLALNHNRVEEIQEQCRLIELRKMLTRYDMRHYNVNETVRAEKLLYYILNQDHESVIEDGMEVVKAYNVLSPAMLYIFRARFLVLNNRIGECLDMLRSLPAETAKACGERLVLHAIIRLDSKVTFSLEENRRKKLLFTKTAYEVLQLLMDLENTDASEREEYRRQLKMMKNLSALQEEFGEFLTSEQYSQMAYRKKLLMKHISTFFKLKEEAKIIQYSEDLERDKNTWRCKSWSYTRIYRLAEVLEVSRDLLLGQMAINAANSGDVQTAVNMTRELYEYVPDGDTAEVLYKVAHALCVLQAQDTPACQHINNLAAIIHQMASQALTICKPDLLADCMELCKCTSLANSVSRQCERGDYGISVRNTSHQRQDLANLDPYEEWTFDNMFREDGLVMDSTIATPLVYQYTIACLPTPSTSSPPYIQHRIQGTSHQAESQVLRLSKVAQEVVQHLRENSQFEQSFQYTVDTISASLQHVNISGIPLTEQSENLSADRKNKKLIAQQVVARGLSTMKDQICILLEKIFNQREVDHGMALGLTCALTPNLAWERLNKMREKCAQHYKRILAIASVGIDFAEIQKEVKFLVKAKELETNAHWGHRLAKLKIPFKDAFGQSNDSKKDLIPQIVQHSAVDVQLVKEYCSAFKLEADEAMLTYLEHILLPHEGSTADDKLPSYVKTQLQKATHIVAEVANKSNLHDKLESIMMQLDPYDYERLHFVISNMDADPSAAKKLKLLDFLKLYKRTSAPSQYELHYKLVTEEDQLMYGNRRMSLLAKERLPYHPFISGDPWKIMTPELNTETVHIWLPVATLLKMPRDTVYVTAIRNIVTQHVEQLADNRPAQDGMPPNKHHCNWDLTEGIDNSFFETVRKLLLQVSYSEMAIACAGWIVKELPMGAEKVVALKACVFLAQKWTEICEKETPEYNKAQEAFIKFSDISKRLSTEQVLFQYGLGEESLLQLTNSPAKLVFKLYEHSSISHRGSGISTVQHLPDLHKAADEISKINNLNIERIRVKLVEKWLPSTLSHKQDEADMTMIGNQINMDLTVRSEEDVTEDEVNLKRVIYLLQHGALEANSLFLLNFAYTTDTTKITNVCRVRAFQCLFSLVDNKTIERLAKKNIDEIKAYMQVLLYLVELDHLHVPQNLASFNRCNKEGLVRGIWRNHNHQTQAVRLVADMCLDYNIVDIQLWNSILQQLLAFQMYEYLRHVLVCLSGVPDLWQVDCVQNMWKSVLLIPLTTGVPPLTEAQTKDCLQSANLLHRCPLLLDMDVVQFAKHFLRLELPVCALGCLLLVPESEIREKHMTVIWNQVSKEDISCQMTEWTAQGRLIPMADQLRDLLVSNIKQEPVYSPEKIVKAHY